MQEQSLCYTKTFLINLKQALSVNHLLFDETVRNRKSFPRWWWDFIRLIKIVVILRTMSYFVVWKIWTQYPITLALNQTEHDNSDLLMSSVKRCRRPVAAGGPLSHMRSTVTLPRLWSFWLQTPQDPIYPIFPFTWWHSVREKKNSTLYFLYTVWGSLSVSQNSHILLWNCTYIYLIHMAGLARCICTRGLSVYSADPDQCVRVSRHQGTRLISCSHVSMILW